MKRTKLPKCHCGCGQEVPSLGKRFQPGHNLKIPLSEKAEKKRRKKISKSMKTLCQDPDHRKKMKKKAWAGRPHSEETKKKLSKLRTGPGNGMYGKTLSKEARKKLSQANKGKIISEETKQKISRANKGKPVSKEQRAQISKTLKKWNQNNESAWKGRKHKPESLKKMSKALKGVYTGNLASNWQGGKSSFPYGIEWTPHLRDKIRNRDRWQCRNPKCNNPHEVLDVHHIDYDKQNNSFKNLITICKRCHGKTQKKRWFWIKYYKNIMKNKPSFIRTKNENSL